MLTLHFTYLLVCLADKSEDSAHWWRHERISTRVYPCTDQVLGSGKLQNVPQKYSMRLCLGGGGGDLMPTQTHTHTHTHKHISPPHTRKYTNTRISLLQMPPRLLNNLRGDNSFNRAMIKMKAADIAQLSYLFVMYVYLISI